MIKTCAICGKQFEAKNGRSKFCPGPHYATCSVCGKLFQVDKRIYYYYENKDKGVCCSRSCAIKWGNSKQTAEQRKQRAAKCKQTKLNRYGDSNYNNSDKMKQTKSSWSSDRKKSISDKAKSTCLQKYGVDNAAKTQSCKDKVKQSVLEKYGVDNVAKLDSSKQKSKQTCLQRYNVETVFQSDEFKQKAAKTNIEKYGCKYAMQNADVRKKQQQTCLKRYGVEHASQATSVKVKSKNTMIERYGDWYRNTAEYSEKVKQTSLSKYGVEHYTQSDNVKRKVVKTNNAKLGVDYPMQSDAVKQKAKNTMLNKYGVEHPLQNEELQNKANNTTNDHFGVQHPLQSYEVKQKVVETNNKKLGTDWPLQSKQVQAKSRRTMLERYGAEHPSKVPEIRRKQVANARTSKLEIRVANLLDQYGIVYVTQFVVSKEEHTHAFDFYIPEYKILLDADGVYYHSYISDPDGKQVRDDYDEVRMYLVPEDHIFILAVEGQEEKAIKHVYDVIKSIDADVFSYDTELFKWCRSIDFPYPKYSNERMLHDWDMLCSYENSKYVPQCKLGMSIVKNFHPSIYDARVGNSVSTKEAWHDDAKLKKVIANRLIYQNTVDPNKVLQGFNISKIAPTVSLFNPVLARYLTLKYLSEYKEVFDSFSGFSGRLLGVASTGKQYCGQDISSAHVQESSSIVEFLSLQSCCSVSCADVLESTGTYDCLLTCPPYSSKETYGSETEFKSCDEWIDECTRRFSCKAYVFVVDSTEKYKQYVTETLHNSSHFSKSKEYVVVIK